MVVGKWGEMYWLFCLVFCFMKCEICMNGGVVC